MTVGVDNDSSAGVEVKEEQEEEETLGQLRDRQVLASARAAAPGPRAPFVHIKVEDTDGEEGTDGEGGGGKGKEATDGEREVVGVRECVEVKEEEKVEAEAEAEPRDLRAHEFIASLTGGSEAVRLPRLLPGARSEPGSSRVRLRAPYRVADNAVQNTDDGEEGNVPELVMCGGAGSAGSSQFMGVSWNRNKNKWQAHCKGAYLGIHTTEEGAARAYNEYLNNGINPVKHRGAITSQFKGVSWDKHMTKWRAVCNGTRLGYHATEEEAARAYSKYLEDGIDPIQHRAASSLQFTGVSWDKSKSTWKAKCKGMDLGRHAAEEDAAHAYSKYLNHGIDPVKHREHCTSHFTGVHWNQPNSKWKAQCKGTYLGYHTTENAAARAYNIEAERRGLDLNVIPPTGAAGAGAAGAGPGAGVGSGAKRAGAGLKRAAPMTSATPALSKNMKL
jgi:hypothetical protein